MSLDSLITLGYWNALAKSHLPELVMVLTAAVVTLLDRYVRKHLSKLTSSRGVVSRFLIFLLVCSVGYACLTLGTAWVLRSGLTMYGGAYMSVVAASVLVVVAVEALRQRQV